MAQLFNRALPARNPSFGGHPVQTRREQIDVVGFDVAEAVGFVADEKKQLRNGSKTRTTTASTHQQHSNTTAETSKEQ